LHKVKFIELSKEILIKWIIEEYSKKNSTQLEKDFGILEIVIPIWNRSTESLYHSNKSSTLIYDGIRMINPKSSNIHNLNDKQSIEAKFLSKYFLIHPNK